MRYEVSIQNASPPCMEGRVAASLLGFWSYRFTTALWSVLRMLSLDYCALGPDFTPPDLIARLSSVFPHGPVTGGCATIMTPCRVLKRLWC